MFYKSYQCNLNTKSFVDDFGLQTYDLVQPCLLGWKLDKSTIRITKKCKKRFVIHVDCAIEVEFKVLSLDACKIMFGGLYLWDSDVTFYSKEDK